MKCSYNIKNLARGLTYMTTPTKLIHTYRISLRILTA